MANMAYSERDKLIDFALLSKVPCKLKYQVKFYFVYPHE